MPRTGIATAVLVVAVTAFHIWATWATPSLAWGDYGIWLSQVERFAEGEVPYIDFYAQYPPMVYWIIGGLVQVVGTDLQQIWFITCGLFVLLIVAFFAYANVVLPPKRRLLVILATLVFGFAYANLNSAPLPLGMYTPAAPIAVALMLAAAALALRFIKSPGLGEGILLGILCATCIFTKQDVWLPAIYMCVASSLIVLRLDRVAGCLISITPILAAATCMIAYALLWVPLIGTEGLQLAFTPRSQFEYALGRGLPSWERLITELNMIAAVVFLLAVTLHLSGMRARQIPWGWRMGICIVIVTAVLHVAMSYKIGSTIRDLGEPAWMSETQEFMSGAATSGRLAIIKRGVHYYVNHARTHLLPFLLPLIVLLAVAWKRHRLSKADRVLVLFLLGLCVAARARRQFEHVEWFHFLLEMPVYFLIVERYTRGEGRVAQRAVTALASLALIVALNSYYVLGRGEMTQRRHAVYVDTARGALRVPPNTAGDFEWLQHHLARLDPTGQRPLLMQGYTSGFNYYLDRPNPTPLMLGFHLSSIEIEVALHTIRALVPEPFLLANRAFENIPVLRTNILRWDFQGYPSFFVTKDSPAFEDLVAECQLAAITGSKNRPFFRLYDCVRQR